MKLLFFSDIHGVPAALEKLLDHADRLAPDKLLLLGDALYHGPRNGVPVDYDTSRTAALLNERADMLLAVRGNCDSEVDQMMLTFPILADFAEVGACGTAVVITPIHHIFYKDQTFTYGNEIGEVSSKLYYGLKAIQYGEAEDKHNWMFIVD